MTKTPERYGTVVIVLHWVIALLVLFLIALGLYMDHASIDDPTALHTLHKSVGITTMVLIIVRIVWRLTRNLKAPAFPPSVPKVQRVAAGSVEGILYLFQILLPATGWLAMSSMAMPIVLFGWVSWPLIPLPESVMDDGDLPMFLLQLHQWFSWAFAGFIALHILAALYHAVVKRDGVVARMMLRRPSK